MASLIPVVVAGPSGVGKGTIVKRLMDKYPSLFGFSVSHTTRAPRPGEEDGVHYNFVEKSAMEAAIANGEFIEHAAVHTNFYGTSIAAVDKVKSEGKVCILDIDIQVRCIIAIVWFISLSCLVFTCLVLSCLVLPWYNP